ncbi:MAG: hypothetical protein HY876_06060 [Coriobacteriales bacterium]|nr:hypothetical protein [Coriobacteriales bacterium]
MGRNAAIKRYNAKPEGQPMELLETRRSRMPVVIELLKSPWLSRASDLLNGTVASKKTEEAVTVVWDAERRCPSAFRRGEKTYRIDAIVQVWATERAWWDPRAHVSRRFWRVLARGGVYDLAYDRIEAEWRLVGIQD